MSRQRSLFENQKEEPPKDPLERRPSRGETTGFVKQQVQAETFKQQAQAETKPQPPPSPTKPTFGRQNSITGNNDF